VSQLRQKQMEPGRRDKTPEISLNGGVDQANLCHQAYKS
jgi:hypothetical protein